MPLFYENKAVYIAADTVTARPGTISCQGVEWAPSLSQKGTVATTAQCFQIMLWVFAKVTSFLRVSSLRKVVFPII